MIKKTDSTAKSLPRPLPPPPTPTSRRLSAVPRLQTADRFEGTRLARAASPGKKLSDMRAPHLTASSPSATRAPKKGLSDPAPVKQARSAATREDARAESIVRDSYQELLGREPDAGGMKTWSNVAASAMRDGATPAEARARVEEGIKGSDEYKKTHPEPMIERLYQDLLQRPADGGGLETWSGVAKQMAAEGKSTAEIEQHVAEQIKGSQEYRDLHGPTASEQVMANAAREAGEINSTGGYRFDGENDCWGFVQRAVNPVLAEKGLAPLPLADAGTAAGAENWDPIQDWNAIPEGTPLSTEQGHAWGDKWHGAVFAGVHNGVPMMWDSTSETMQAQLRPIRPGTFSHFYTPAAEAFA